MLVRYLSPPKHRSYTSVAQTLIRLDETQTQFALQPMHSQLVLRIGKQHLWDILAYVLFVRD